MNEELRKKLGEVLQPLNYDQGLSKRAMQYFKIGDTVIAVDSADGKSVQRCRQ